MGIFGRMKTLLKANVNDLADKAENPEVVLNQLILDMQEQLSKAKLEVRDTIADQKRLEKQRDKAQQESQDWERKAMSAVKAGRDDLATEALTRKQEADERASEYQAQWEAQKANSDQLVVALRGLAAKIEEAKRRKGTLVARAKRVDAQKAMATTAGVTNDTSAFDSFERSAQKIEDFEASVSATAELSDELRHEDLDRKFTAIEDKHGADDALAALKQKMGYDD